MTQTVKMNELFSPSGLASQVFFEVVSLLGENVVFFSHLRFGIQRNSDHKSPKIKLYSVRPLTHELNDKSLTHGRVTTTISRNVL